MPLPAGIAIIAIGICALVMTTSAYATQVVPTDVEYSNDDIEQGGKPQACVVTAAITNAPAPEVVNFQFLRFTNGRVAFKVTAGDMNWAGPSLVAKRISEAERLIILIPLTERLPPKDNWWHSL